MMSHPDAADAWRLFHYNWIVIAIIAAALGLAMLIGGFSIKLTSMAMPLATIGVYIGAAYYNAFRARKRDPLVIFTLGTTGQILLIALIMTPTTYIAASLAFPFQDATLAAIDRALGLDWDAHFALIARNDFLVTAAVSAYAMISWPVFGVPVALGFGRRYRRLQEFTLALALTLIVTTIISTLVPAVGIYNEQTFTRPDPVFESPAYLEYLHQMIALRDGAMKQIDLMKLAGIITFPSFHAASAILYLWALWSVWWMRPIALAANGAMIAATPFIGGHYFIDIIAGIAVAIGAIAASQWLCRRLLQRSPSVASALAPSAVAAE